MQGKSSPDGLDSLELIQLLTNLTHEAQKIAAQCLEAAEQLVGSEEALRLVTEDAEVEGELSELDGASCPDTFPAEWAE